MIRTSVYAILTGESLRKDKFTNWPQNYVIDFTSIDKGSILIHTHEFFDDQRELLTHFLLTLEDKLSEIERIGIGQITVHLNLAYSGQCNWELNSSQLSLLSKIRAIFTFTAYEDFSLSNGNV